MVQIRIIFSGDYIMIAVALCTLLVLEYQNKVCGRHHSRNQIYLRDKILEWQCRAKCENVLLARFENCLKQCQLEMVKSPRRGHCPFNTVFKNLNVPLHELSCLDNCNFDYDCPEVSKCCQSSCGPVCVEPWGIRDDSLLPPIPKIEGFTLIPREKKVEINSTINSSQTNLTYYFHVESRHHIGQFLRPRKLGVWQYQPVDKIAELRDYNSQILNTRVGFRLRPGRWYQVRLAAINSYGFRGYSESSQAFTLPNHPKPPKKPADLKVVSSHFNGRYYTVKIVWCTSKSNLPIEKYKIIWALYIKNKDESFISNETFVKDRHQFEITHLLPNSSYYIQVQAMSINGRRRLKSELCSILYNTTMAPTQAYSPLKCEKEPQHVTRGINQNLLNDDNSYMMYAAHKQLQRNEQFHGPPLLDNNNTYNSIMPSNAIEIKYCFNRKFELIVNISGFPTHKGRIYELCPQETNCEEYNAIRVTKESLVFSKLNYNTSYILKPRTNLATINGIKGITFVIPPRDHIRKDCPKRNVKCCKNEIKHFK